jgi:hypothetical protein
MTLMMIIACSLLILLDSVALAGSPVFPTAPAGAHHLELPKLTDLKIPPLAPPLAQPQIPIDFFGCWVGNPRKFDTVLPAPGVDSLYRLRKITKCYMPSGIQTQEFTLELTPRYRMLDVVLGFLSLGAHGAQVAQENTGVYAVTADQVYSRGTLTLNLTAASLLQFPHSSPATVVDEEVATLVDPDDLTIAGRTFITGPAPHSVGTWHADFHH